MSDKSKPHPAERTLSPSTPSQQQGSDAQGQFTAAVDDLLDQLQHKFDTVSREMFGKFDDMARRLDELEASLSAAGDAGTAPTGSPSAK
ncbi:heat shock factor binding protein 1-domain-containing protein [Aspergillus karnatakaensis]|uniref:heat shock factor-binding 1 family protein n=1 Tax=Aspergillus karnatakaensis TaxID=1810916 RepID=UPI003CCE1D29